MDIESLIEIIEGFLPQILNLVPKPKRLHELLLLSADGQLLLKAGDRPPTLLYGIFVSCAYLFKSLLLQEERVYPYGRLIEAASDEEQSCECNSNGYSLYRGYSP